MQGQFQGLVGSLYEEVIGSLVELFSTLGLQGWLIVLTLVVTGMSYRSQKRAGIREAIEQLDPRHVQYRVKGSSRHTPPLRDIQTKAGLNSFSMLKRKSKISFISNRITDRSDRAVGHSVPPYYLAISEQQTGRARTLEERILGHEQIDSVKREESQLVITCSTNRSN